jgi:hypothetical protein
MNMYILFGNAQTFNAPDNSIYYIYLIYLFQIKLTFHQQFQFQKGLIYNWLKVVK